MIMPDIPANPDVWFWIVLPLRVMLLAVNGGLSVEGANVTEDSAVPGTTTYRATVTLMTNFDIGCKQGAADEAAPDPDTLLAPARKTLDALEEVARRRGL
jgi:hypothetical protein